jgi:Mg-chelatase subunit ChlD
MAKHRTARVHRSWLPAVALLVIIGIVVAVATLRARGRETGRQNGGVGARTSPSAAVCTPLRVVAATSFVPVLNAIAPSLFTGPGCVRLDVTHADGRAAAGIAERVRADVWIPDDGSWTATAGSLALTDTAGAGTVLATSPVYLVADRTAGVQLRRTGASWAGLATLVDAGEVRLVIRDPAGSGDGLVGVGAVAEAVWIGQGMDASALWLARATAHTRTVSGSAVALPAASGEVGLVPEYALVKGLPRNGALSVLPGTDYTALLRYTWLPTATGVADPARAAALQRLRTVLAGPGSAAARSAAYLRGADAAGAPIIGDETAALPAKVAKPMGVLGAHHVGHVFATWYRQDRRTDALIVVDVSGSMADPAPGSGTPLIALVRDGVRAAARLLPDDARLGLWEFGVRLDGDSDHRQLLREKVLSAGHRKALAGAVDRLAARRTGTGLHDTILAAYRAARDEYRPGILNQVLVFTDGRDEDDPGGLSARRLREKLRAARDEARPVQLSVVSFGDPGTAEIMQKALEPVDGYVDPLSSSGEVAAVFIHLAAGGLRH